MTKSELVESVARSTGLSKKDSAQALEAVLDTIGRTLSQGERVSIVGFGTFDVRQRAGRVGRNPQTGEEIRIPPRRVPAFRAGRPLRQAVEGGA